MRSRTVADGSISKKILKQKWILTQALNRLPRNVSREIIYLQEEQKKKKPL